MIKVFIFGRKGLVKREVILWEAEAILQKTYADSLGGLVADRRTGEVISEIGPDVQELLVISHMMAGG
jgi:hypothetical protein